MYDFFRVGLCSVGLAYSDLQTVIIVCFLKKVNECSITNLHKFIFVAIEIRVSKTCNQFLHARELLKNKFYLAIRSNRLNFHTIHLIVLGKQNSRNIFYSKKLFERQN